ncbi:MAG TPA: FAD-dependent oxidoreductase [Acidobacteriaceae bacterium]|nr:FAD-dependent oxidoreductase [Acidobacteriaceae bacterium]
MKTVFVVGAGPAGMFAARKIALAGHNAVLFNRDVKPGGLAEYGIYPLKDKMKFGLRKQFAQVLALPNVYYFGNVKIGNGYDLTIADLDAMRPSAVIYTSGAQGAHSLGLPGEHSRGVYAAKDFVYHYNQLPPYASEDFSTGRHVAIIGIGNVAIDIARWLLQDSPSRSTTEEVTIIARRGPLEIKFDKKEIGYVGRHIVPDALAAELDRIHDRCARANQDVSPPAIFAEHFPMLAKDDFTSIPPRLSFRFLSSPTAVIPGSDGRIAQLEVADNDLVLRPDGSTKPVLNGQKAVLDIDTLIFAIGDKHDEQLGLPMGPDGYATQSDPAHPDVPQFKVWDPEHSCPLPGRFVAGWARRASTGLVGIARHDGELGAQQAIDYLQNQPEGNTLSPGEILAALRSKGLRPVTKPDLALLASAEQQESEKRHLNYFKYSDNQLMFQAIEREKSHPSQSGPSTRLQPVS